MASFYKRATPRQAKLLRMIEGACKDAANAHPGQPLNGQLARSIAKRGAGTITSQWRHILDTPRVAAPGVLAANTTRSVGEAGQAINQPARVGEQALRTGAKDGQDSRSAWSRGVSRSSRHAPLRSLHGAVGDAAGAARRAGETERLAAYIDVLRMIAKLMD